MEAYRASASTFELMARGEGVATVHQNISKGYFSFHVENDDFQFRIAHPGNGLCAYN
jgi:hypothetical protein